MRGKCNLRIAIDAMGGDHAPIEVVQGALQAVQEFKDLNITLVGDEAKIIEAMGIKSPNISIIHTDEVITAEDEPARAVRRKKNSSLVLTAKEVKEKRADACISAGNTGALMTAGLFIVGRIKGISRPALCPTFPTIDETGFQLLDVGANVETKANHLLQYAIMGSIYAEKVRGINKPRVGLLNVGTEAGKGNELTKEAYNLLKVAPIHFIGNVESRDLLNGVCDVVVTDGFTGNIALKTMEGTALSVLSLLKNAFTSSLKTKIAAGLMKSKLNSLRDVLDYSEYGGAALFGLKAPVVKAHGSSKRRAIYNAIKQTRYMIEQNMTSMIAKAVEQIEEGGD